MTIAALLCLVIAVSDGDTLTARCGAAHAPLQLKVRIAAIDAPESRQAFGPQARKNLVQLCLRQRARIQVATPMSPAPKCAPDWRGSIRRMRASTRTWCRYSAKRAPAISACGRSEGR